MASHDERQVFIHCGLQKTATTSFHHLVQKNRDRILPHLQVLTPEKGSALRALGFAAMQFSLGRVSANDLAARADAVASEIAGLRGDVLLSHENILGAMPGKDRSGALYPCAEAIVEILAAHLGRAEFLLVTRDMQSWKTSVYGQAVRSDAYAGTRADFDAETGCITEWTGLEDRLTRATGGALRVFRMEDDPTGAALLHACGVPADIVARLRLPKSPANKALRPGALEFLRLVNATGIEKPARRAVVEIVTGNPALFASEVAP